MLSTLESSQDYISKPTSTKYDQCFHCKITDVIYTCKAINTVWVWNNCSSDLAWLLLFSNTNILIILSGVTMDISLLIRVDARQTQLVTSLPGIPIILQLYRLDALTSCTGVLMIDRHSISSTHHYEKWKLLYMCFRQHVTTIILGCRWWLLLQTPHILHEYSLVAQIPTVKTPNPQSFIYTYIHTKYVYIYTLHCVPLCLQNKTHIHYINNPYQQR